MNSEHPAFAECIMLLYFSGKGFPFHKPVIHHLLLGGIISFLVCGKERNCLNISVCYDFYCLFLFSSTLSLPFFQGSPLPQELQGMKRKTMENTPMTLTLETKAGSAELLSPFGLH